MVIQKAIDHLKNRPEDERKAVAGGIATFIAAVLLIGWIVHFFSKMQSVDIQVEQIGSGIKSQFDAAPITDAQKQLVNSYKNTTEQLQAIRDEAALQQAQGGTAN